MQLLTVKALNRFDLTVEGSIERPCAKSGCQSSWSNVHSGDLRVRQQASSLVEDGTVIKRAFLLNYGDIVQMTVII